MVYKHIKEIVIGVLIAGVVAFVTIYVKYRERELYHELSKTIRHESEQIRNEIGAERKSRCQLAAALFKSGIDIPTNVLVSFSCQPEHLEPFNKLLVQLSEELSTLESEPEYCSYKETMLATGASYPVIAKLNDDKYLMSWCKEKPLRVDGCTGEYITRFHLKDPNNVEKKYELAAYGFRSAKDLFCYSEVTTGSIKAIHMTTLALPDDPNKAVQETP